MSQRPLIGVLCCANAVGGEPAQTAVDRYVDAVERSLACDVVLIPTSVAGRDASALLRRLDGVVLTGSPSNVEAHHYGGAATDGPFDAARDGAAFAVVHAAAAARTPIFGICRGLQEINVALGGTLRGDLGETGRDVSHHAPDTALGPALFDWWHEVEIARDGVLGPKLGAERVRVNSVHYQGIARLADGLRVEARAPDGQVEALSAVAAPVFAVQWHPECDPDDPTSRAVFDVFADMVAAARR